MSASKVSVYVSTVAQFTSAAITSLLEVQGVTLSMDGRGVRAKAVLMRSGAMQHTRSTGQPKGKRLALTSQRRVRAGQASGTSLTATRRTSSPSMPATSSGLAV